jgi:hypothetical protein
LFSQVRSDFLVLQSARRDSLRGFESLPLRQLVTTPDLVALTAAEFHAKYFVDEALLVIRLSGAAPPATGRSSQQI